MTLAEEKRHLRDRMRALRRQVSPEARAAAAEALAGHLRALERLADSRVLLGTLAAGAEIDAGALCAWWLAQGRILLLPRVGDDGISLHARRVEDLAHCRPGFRGCPEPDPEHCPPARLDDIEAVLVPGLAFDPAGRRLGQGGGHYDRLLAECPPQAVAIGIGFDFQILERLPEAGHDRRVDWIVTPSGAHRAVG